MVAKEKQTYKDWERTRQLEFTMYATTFAGMSGEQVYKKIKRPVDLYKLPTDSYNLKPIKVDRVQASKDVENMKKHFKWTKDSIKHN